MTLPFERLLPRLLNHLIQNEAWAAERLRPFDGKQALIRLGAQDIYLVLDSRGFFAAGSAKDPVAVTVNLPADTPAKLLLDKDAVFQAARLSGSIDFAETLAFVFRNLRWDIEADLAAYVGDIPAYRLEKLRRNLLSATREASSKATQNVVEYLTEDSNSLPAPREVVAFIREVDVLRDAVARLEKRLDRL